MRNTSKLLEIEALTENVAKQFAENNLLKMKVLYFVSQYNSVSQGLIVDKLGIKKSNFALLTRQLTEDGLLVCHSGEIDKRIRILSLTEKGQQTLDAFMNKLDEFFVDETPDVKKAIDVVCKYLNRKI